MAERGTVLKTMNELLPGSIVLTVIQGIVFEAYKPPDEEHGYVFTRHQAEDALTNGTRIAKAVYEPQDAHHVGALGTVIGSMVNDMLLNELFYFVIWDDAPTHPVGVRARKIKEYHEDSC